ncbi:TetR family transcriptional regulator [Salinibacterium sp. ZJ77]|uniref:acyl-CoA-like ligand-binding transcription factor n=1 Tax=Salinibacterium sp. ZJ77 TaxID=2708337 RepID=UPI00141E65F9|nr:TetR family transcriptional regulator [Salinibacterium sp. ZJ77]
MTSSSPRRGRPPVADVEELRAAALAHIERVGFENVSMATLAHAVGVSLRTLHRYFPSKSDIVWGGLEQSIDALRDGMRHADDALPAITAISDVVVRVFALTDDDLAVMRARLRLIALSPELRASQSSTFDAWKSELVAFIARRRGESTNHLMPVVLGAAVHTAIMESLTWWASTDSVADPAECVAAALRGLDDA